jgi:hypothetical protein
MRRAGTNCTLKYICMILRLREDLSKEKFRKNIILYYYFDL